MKFAPDRPWSDPEKAARKLLEIANAVDAVQDGRIYIVALIAGEVAPAAQPAAMDPGPVITLKPPAAKPAGIKQRCHQLSLYIRFSIRCAASLLRRGSRCTSCSSRRSTCC